MYKMILYIAILSQYFTPSHYPKNARVHQHFKMQNLSHRTSAFYTCSLFSFAFYSFPFERKELDWAFVVINTNPQSATTKPSDFCYSVVI